MRQAVKVLMVGGDTYTYAIPVDTSIFMLEPSGTELRREI